MRNESPDVQPLMTLYHAYYINLFMLEGLALETRIESNRVGIDVHTLIVCTLCALSSSPMKSVKLPSLCCVFSDHSHSARATASSERDSKYALETSV